MDPARQLVHAAMGVYRLGDEGGADWYCESFVYWLRLLVEKDGRVNEPLAPL